MATIKDGWVAMDSIKGGSHHYDRGFPACGWSAHLQMDEHGRCLACVQALQKKVVQKIEETA